MIILNPKAILLAKLTETELVDLANFDCGDQEMNSFLINEAYNEQELGMNTTILIYYEGRLAGFYSICCDSIKISDEEKQEDLTYSSVPAIKIARLGRDVNFKKFGIGKYLIQHVIHRALEINDNYCGVRMITLDAYPTRYEYYCSLGFKPNLHRMYNGKNRDTISMRLDIFEEILEQEKTGTEN